MGHNFWHWEHMIKLCFCVWYAKCAKYLAFGTFSTSDAGALRVFIVGYKRNVKSQFSAKQGILVTWSHDWNESRVNCKAKLYFLSCSALAVMTLQFPACFARVALWWLASREIQLRLLLNAYNLSLFTLSHTQPLHYSHLNTGFLHVELQANLARNKANIWLIKFNLIVLMFPNFESSCLSRTCCP